MNDKSLRGRANIVERIAGYEGQAGSGCVRYYGGIARDSYLYPIYLVSRDTGSGSNLDLIVRASVFQSAKVSIAVSRNSDISRLTRERSSFDMPHAMLKSPRCRPFQNHHRYSNPGNIDAAQDISLPHR